MPEEELRSEGPIPSRYRGSQRAANAFKAAVADLYLESSASDILGFDVHDEDGRLVGRFEGFVTRIGITSEQFATLAKAAG